MSLGSPPGPWSHTSPETREGGQSTGALQEQSQEGGAAWARAGERSLLVRQAEEKGSCGYHRLQ